MFESFNKKINRRNTGCIKWDLQAQDGRIPFGIADSDYPTAPCIIQAIQKRTLAGHFGYTILGNDYYQSIAEWYQKSHNVEINSDWIIPSTGVLRAIKIAIETMSNPGDTVILQTPVYSHFYDCLQSLNRPIVENKLINDNEKYSMDFEDLEEKFKQGNKILLMCSPHNPVGRVWTYEELEKVSKLAVKYGVTIISDEIHSDLILGDNKFTSMLEFKELHDRLYVASAPSKTFNLAGLLSSYLICPNAESKTKCLEFVEKDMMTPISLLSAEATIEAYSNPEAFDWMKTQNLFIESNYELAVEYIEKHLPHAVCAPLEGTYLMWINLCYLGMNSKEICDYLAEAGVSVNGGGEYGLTDQKYQGYIRLNLACPQSQLKAGLKIIASALKKVKVKVK